MYLLVPASATAVVEVRSARTSRLELVVRDSFATSRWIDLRVNPLVLVAGADAGCPVGTFATELKEREPVWILRNFNAAFAA